MINRYEIKKRGIDALLDFDNLVYPPLLYSLKTNINIQLLTLNKYLGYAKRIHDNQYYNIAILLNIINKQLTISTLKRIYSHDKYMHDFYYHVNDLINIVREVKSEIPSSLIDDLFYAFERKLTKKITKNGQIPFELAYYILALEMTELEEFVERYNNLSIRDFMYSNTLHDYLFTVHKFHRGITENTNKNDKERVLLITDTIFEDMKDLPENQISDYLQENKEIINELEDIVKWASRGIRKDEIYDFISYQLYLINLEFPLYYYSRNQSLIVNLHVLMSLAYHFYSNGIISEDLFYYIIMAYYTFYMNTKIGNLKRHTIYDNIIDLNRNYQAIVESEFDLDKVELSSNFNLIIIPEERTTIISILKEGHNNRAEIKKYQEIIGYQERQTLSDYKAVLRSCYIKNLYELHDKIITSHIPIEQPTQSYLERMNLLYKGKSIIKEMDI